MQPLCLEGVGARSKAKGASPSAWCYSLSSRCGPHLTVWRYQAPVSFWRCEVPVSVPRLCMCQWGVFLCLVGASLAAYLEMWVSASGR